VVPGSPEAGRRVPLKHKPALAAGVILATVACLFPGSLEAQVPPAPLADSAPDSAAVHDTLGQEASPPLADSLAADASGIPVVFRGDTLGFLFAPLGEFSARERAAALTVRLGDLRRDGARPEDIRVSGDPENMAVMNGVNLVLMVTPGDAQGLGLPYAEAADVYAELVRQAVSGRALTRTLQSILIGAGLTLLATVILILLFRLLARIYPRIYARITEVQEDKLPSIRFQRLELMSGEQLERVFLAFARASRLVLSVVLLLLYFPLVFSFFPATRVLAQQFLRLLWEPMQMVGVAVVRYLPNLFSIAVILVVTYYGLRILRLFFLALKNETIHIRGFYPDWAIPTFNIVRILAVVFSIILIWPYLPNSESAVFRGVAAFMGLLVTFGSAGAVSNAVGGIVMVYMRPFQVGDRVRIADTIGDVVERGILVTRVRTPKNVEITIPNSMVVGSHIVNYSNMAKGSGVILHTTVTIGYDVPWQKVHDAMKEAAGRVDGILEEPGPFVLQTALGDYAVSYELNAYTKMPKMMQQLYSQLHCNIQDSFAEAGIEILSPAYHALRDGNLSTIPEPHTPRVSARDAFRIRTLGGAKGGDD